MTGCDLRPLIDNTNLISPMQSFPTRKNADAIPQTRCLACSRFRKKNGMIPAFSLPHPWDQIFCTSFFLMRNPYIDCTNCTHAVRHHSLFSAVIACMPADSYAMSALDRQESLPHLLLQNIRRISGQITDAFSHLQWRYFFVLFYGRILQ